MKTIIILLSLVFLISCASQEPVVKGVELIKTEIIVTAPTPVVVQEPVSEPEVVSEEPVAPELVPVEPEQVNQTFPVGGEVHCPIPERYTFVDGNCVEDECMDKTVTCITQGNKIMRPECECWVYFGEAICSIKGAERTIIESPLCMRRGQSGKICGAYDSNKRHCVNF